MYFIDTHAHLYAEQFDADRAAMIQRAIDAGVKKILLPNIDLTSAPKMEQMVKDYPGVCYAMMGVHPTDVEKDWESQLAKIKNLFVPGHHIAIGEIGIDLYWDKSLQKEQTEVFRAQVQWAKAVNLPIVIHARDSFDEIFEVVDQENDERLSGVFHCFTGTEEQARKILDYGGFKLGIGGVVTFKNSGVDQSIQQLGLEHLILETDAPYLAPAPFRGKRNESAYIPFIAKKLSDIYGISEEEVAKITTQNAIELFNLND